MRAHRRDAEDAEKDRDGAGGRDEGLAGVGWSLYLQREFV